MLRKLLFSFGLLLVASLTLKAQNEGAIKVVVTDEKTNESLPFTPVVVMQNNQQISGGQTDIDGNIIIKPLAPGKYDVKVQSVGYQAQVINGVVVSVSKTTQISVKLKTISTTLDAVVVTDYKKPLIDPDTKSGGTVTREEFQAMPSKNLNAVASTSAGVYQSDEGKDLSVRGGRTDATVYFVDGQRVIGKAALPQQGVEQITTITGGVPAMYGDVTGGIISVTTRGPMPKYTGGLEAISSQVTDAYGYNNLGFSFGGPLVMKTDSSGVKKSVFGFFISGQGGTVKDPQPSAVGAWKVKDNVLKDIEENPLRISESGGGFNKSAEYVTKNDLEPIKYRQNVRENTLSFSAKLAYKPTDNTDITFGGSFDLNSRKGYFFTYSLFNNKNNPQVIDRTGRAFVRLNQKFGSSSKDNEKSQSNLKNAYFSIQAEFENYQFTQQNPVHKGNLFDYGYIGKFQHYRAPNYSFAERTVNGQKINGMFLSGYRDTLMTFEPSDLNYTASLYTRYVYDNYNGVISSADQVRLNLGLMNGDFPSNTYVYSLFLNTGTINNYYETVNNDKFRVFSTFSVDIKDHAVQLGFEYDQRTLRDYQLNPGTLWGLMKLLVNTHINYADTNTTPVLNTKLSNTLAYYDYGNSVNLNAQTAFDRNFRKSLGLKEDEWIDIDSYDPSKFNMKMFSADDLLNGNSQWPYGGSIQYYGYDPYGNKLKSKPSFDEFFTAKNADNDYVRSIGAFQPIYVAGFIQDRFDFKNIKFNVGVRVDRYDANQKVLKDKYVMNETVRAGAVDYNKFGAEKPGNIGDDYVVYVNQIKDPTRITGYRNGETWYNAKGVEVQDPKTEIADLSNGKIAPYLVDQDNVALTAKAFKDYTPQINVMPRIAFSFPISDVANFFAHYDVLTQRPSSGTGRMNVVDYMFITNNAGAVVTNPDLKPTRTTDYELGFQQVLSEKKNASITLSAFYREMRNMVNIRFINQAYPTGYLTYDNIDFGTVKGFTVGYQLRRAGGMQLSANYTLQFADGTGSSANSGYNLASTGQPNLRVAIPLNFDQRHGFVINGDYRFGSGSDYRGPVWTKKKGDASKTIQVLKNVGANIVFRGGSGTPFSRQGNITPDAKFGLNLRSVLKGSVNGSNLPWNFRMDLRVDKNIELTWKSKKEGEGNRMANLNIYASVLNVLNLKNILSVYKYTGNPDDDGFIHSALAQPEIDAAVSAQSYIDLYNIKVNNPANYSIPRQIRLGLLLDF